MIGDIPPRFTGLAAGALLAVSTASRGALCLAGVVLFGAWPSPLLNGAARASQTFVPRAAEQVNHRADELGFDAIQIGCSARNP